MKKWLLFVLLAVSAFVLYWGTTAYTSGEGAIPPLHTEPVHTGDVLQRVVAFGTLQPVQKVTVGSQVSGIIEELFADFNSPVRRGEVIAQIDPSTFAANVRTAEAELESAEASLELARTRWERMQRLREQQFVALSEVEEADATLRQAEAQVRVRRHALDRAQLELDRATIYSPTDGIVISRNVDVGQTVAASLSAPDLFEIAADLRRMQIHALVSEADIGRVSNGQSVRFQVDGYRERTFVGEVIQVRNAPVMEDNVVHYETIISVNNDELLLKPGMSAEVNIITAESHNVVKVRNTTLRARLPDAIRPTEPEGSGTTVYRYRNGQLEAMKVRTGMSDGVYTVIHEGASPGDTLAVGLRLLRDDESDRRSLFSGSQATF
ncbi:MAG: efflux RND transporter periplasmic adaptor subunit [Balneolaceae bacterium]